VSSFLVLLRLSLSELTDRLDLDLLFGGLGDLDSFEEETSGDGAFFKDFLGFSDRPNESLSTADSVLFCEFSLLVFSAPTTQVDALLVHSTH